jgi:uncharacterized protein (TIGR02266 family)
MDQPTSKEPRGPVSLRIKFRSASLDQFIERYAVDVSRGGIFIRTREPLAVGTPLRFDFQLQDGSALLAGDGTIVWIRENDPSRAGVTPGMGVRFDKLSPASQPVLEKILADKARREQSGAPPKTAPGGIAVRRPSSTFSALDPAAAPSAPARVGGLSPLGTQRTAGTPAGSPPLAAGAQPRAAAPAAGSAPLATGAQPRAAAPTTGSAPLGAQPRTTAPAIGSDAFGTGRAPGASNLPRTSENPIPTGVPGLEGSGAFGRPRATTGSNAQRPAPAPAALFEKPTADDIDRALSVLTEVDGPSPSFASPEEPGEPVRRRTDAQPVLLEAAPDVGTGPVARRHPTDAQPLVLEAAPDVGDAPARRSTGTRPLFTASATAETKSPTVPVATLGDGSLADDEDDEEEDATSAWVGSGPTRVGSTNPELPAAAATPSAKAPPPKSDEPPAPPVKAPPLSAAPPAVATTAAAAPSLDAPVLPAKAPGEAPVIMKPNFVAPKPPAAKKGSGVTMAVVGVLLAAAAGGGGWYYLKGQAPAPSAPPAPTAAAPTEGTPPPAAAEGTTPPSPATGAPAGTEKAAAPENAAAPAQPAGGGTATPSTLRARPEGEAPPPAAAAPAAPEAKPDDKAAEAKERRHRKRREESAAEAPAPEKAAEPAKTEAAPAAEGAAPAAAEAKAPAAAGHLLKITSSPAGAEVIIDGTSMGTTPFSNGDVDPALPHSVTIKKDGFEAYEHMIGGSDWPQPKKGVRTLKLNAKLHATGGAAETAKPAEPEAPSEPPPGLGTTPASPKRE